MKIIEALKELPLLEKRVQDVCVQLNTYASLASSEEPALGTEDAHKKKVKELKQKAIDLIRYYERLKNALELTNCSIIVDIEGQKRTIREWITVRMNTQRLYAVLFQSFNLNHANAILQQMRPDLNKEGTAVSLKRMYSDEEVNNERQQYELMIGKIDSALEVVNATTELVEKI